MPRESEATMIPSLQIAAMTKDPFTRKGAGPAKSPATLMVVMAPTITVKAKKDPSCLTTRRLGRSEKDRGSNFPERLFAEVSGDEMGKGADENMS
jgi:hypothetical protein